MRAPPTCNNVASHDRSRNGKRVVVASERRAPIGDQLGQPRRRDRLQRQTRKELLREALANTSRHRVCVAADRLYETGFSRLLRRPIWTGAQSSSRVDPVRIRHCGPNIRLGGWTRPLHRRAWSNSSGPPVRVSEEALSAIRRRSATGRVNWRGTRPRGGGFETGIQQ